MLPVGCGVEDRVSCLLAARPATPWHPDVRIVDHGCALSSCERRLDVWVFVLRCRLAEAGDDLVFVYTGGTTGSPKAVMWRSDDLYLSLWQMARPGTRPPDVEASMRDGKRAATCLPACPLMHGTGLFIALSTLAGGGAVVLLDTPRLDADAVWDAVDREHVQACTIVGDAFARPLLAALDAAPHRWDLSGLRSITSSGVTWSPQTKRGLLAHLPHVILIDSLGASEGIMTRTETRDGDEIAPARFKASERVVVVTDDGELVQPGDEVIGMLGGGDCAPFDPRRYSGAVDTPGNGIDEDCDGSDLHLLPIAPRAR